MSELSKLETFSSDAAMLSKPLSRELSNKSDYDSYEREATK